MTHVDALREDRHPLTDEEVGRVAFLSDDDYPVILPVNFFLDRDLIMFRTEVGSKLDSVPLRPVAFEVEHLAADHSGWSILVQGRGRDVTDVAGQVYGALRERHLDTWARARTTTGWPSRSTGSRGAASCASSKQEVRREDT
jgi:nitroimidazol reductase NimA-like FMN-containing flavoprotein (pyridoxamine 5'-phosphate oxidase superfamily)